MRRFPNLSRCLLISLGAGGLLGCSDAEQGSAFDPDGASEGGGAAGTSPVQGGSGGAAGSGVPGVSGSAGATSVGGSAGGPSGSGGQVVGGSGGADPADDNPTGCLPEFEAVCDPEIDFQNEDPGNSANFDAVVSDVEATMKWAACTVCSVLYRSADEVPRTHDTIHFVIDDHEGVAYASGSSIHLSTNHIQNFPDPADALLEFRGVMVHETAHLYQENGGSSDGALIEGIADFVRIRVGLYGDGRRNQGGGWDDAYTTSGFFFSWLAGPCEYHDDHHPQNDLDVGYRINQRMPDGKAAIQFELEQSFGTDIDSLWSQYQDAI